MATSPTPLPHRHVIVEVDHFDAAMGLLGDQLTDLRGEIHSMNTNLPAAMALAFREALTDPVTLGKVIGTVADIAQKRAAEKTGNAVGSVLKSFFTKWLVIGCVILIVAKTAGVDVAKTVWAALTH